ncbi:ribosome recycling factor [candidate division KSB1 bacterium]|nr:ribosome recycling factor [candidate division KSB1 bacterium]NIR68466.1 ribosome recycling factor [candidate division KSB1 bacterium]NIS25117.1 ribosome recycling factor [candidate division KSB1 bacterium]NIT72029.1 ribosome recycling factor [candidate division KSB1 bacterium]NIU25816.1 ribosome recycling factor [candidate division KSB1 bacterium]
MNIKEIQKDADVRMRKAVDNTRSELSKIRTGKASPALLDTIRVSYYGSMVPLKQVAGINTPEPRLITIQPWEKNMIGEIEKAILKSDLGLNPANDGTLIRLPIPQLTEERRKDLVRLCHKLAEEGRIAIRNVRRDANDKLKKLEKNNDISEDQFHTATDEVQKITDTYTAEVDELLKKKEEEIMEV